MSDWCEDLRQRLDDLSRKVNSDAFVSAFPQATIAALKTHQNESWKRCATPS